jgi:periplasmic divalent cation tolerance protein
MAANETRVCTVLTTAPDTEMATRLARKLVEERLAACVNVLPGVQSIYRWEGTVKQDSEVLLLIKSRTGLMDALAARIKDLHSYEVPEVLVLSVSGGSVQYLDWVETETTS